MGRQQPEQGSSYLPQHILTDTERRAETHQTLDFLFRASGLTENQRADIRRFTETLAVTLGNPSSYPEILAENSVRTANQASRLRESGIPDSYIIASSIIAMRLAVDERISKQR